MGRKVSYECLMELACLKMVSRHGASGLRRKALLRTGRSRLYASLYAEAVNCIAAANTLSRLFLKHGNRSSGALPEDQIRMFDRSGDAPARHFLLEYM